MRLLDLVPVDSHKTLIVAEVSGNHAGRIENCIELIHAAKYAGADAVKFQTYRPDTLTLDSHLPDFMIPTESPWASFGNQYSLYSQAHTPWEWHPQLFQTARELGLLAFSSPFDESAVDFLESLDCPIYKLASPEINHIPLIKKIASTGKPIVISLGVSSGIELERAIETFDSISDAGVAILQCDTNYPASLENANLKQIPHLVEKFGKVVGYSDHTLGSIAATTAVTMGARIVEKHIKIEGSDFSPDTFFSTEREDFRIMVDNIRAVEKLFGKSEFRQVSGEEDLSIRRSLYPAENLSKGQLIEKNSLRVVRPGFGIPPIFLENLIGHRAKRDLQCGERVTLDDFEPDVLSKREI